MAKKTDEKKGTAKKGGAKKPGKAKEVEVTVVGIGPGLLMDRMPEETLDAIRTRTTIRIDRGSMTEDEEAGGKVYRASDGQTIAFPVENVLACLKNGGRKVKIGRAAITKATGETMLFSILNVMTSDGFVPVTNGNGGPATDDCWEVDKRKGSNNDNSANCLIRPKFPTWGMKFTVRIGPDGDEKIVKQLIEAAGMSAGMGSFRPKTGGPFGMFEIAEDGWNVTKTAAA